MKTRDIFLSLAVLSVVGFCLSPLGTARGDDPQADEFIAHVKALPYPPDTREIEFRSIFKRIEFTSQSSLGALAAFYRAEMKKRGWEEDAKAEKIEDDSVDLTFKHGDAEVKVELDKRSKATLVRLGCKKLDFEGSNDPAAMLAAGVPQPQSYLFLQKNIPLPEKIQGLSYDDDECKFKSTMKLQEAFNHFVDLAKSLGWQQSLRVLSSDNRRYTEFKKGPVELSVNIFDDEVGSRIILGYESSQKEATVPPLPDVALASINKPAGTPAGKPSPTPTVQTGVDVSKNKGKATVTFGKKKYVFTHVAAYQMEENGNLRTALIFADKAIPYKRMQAALKKDKEDFSFLDLYEFDSPNVLTIGLNKYTSFSFSADGYGIGRSIDEPVREVKIENGRVVATIKMPSEEIFDKPFHFVATIEAGLMSPTTRVLNAVDPPPSVSPLVESAGLPLPEGTLEVQSGGSQYRRSATATVKMEMPQVEEFYRSTAATKKWREVPAKAGDAKPAAGVVLNYRDASGPIHVVLTPKGKETVVQITTRNEVKAKQDGVLPEPGKARLILGNAHTRPVVITIVKRDYTLKPGQGGRDLKTALNYTVVAGKYPLTIKTPGEKPQSEELNITEGTTWGVIALPTGGYFADQLY
ncbi:hypothetical protein Mal52_52450 [Symmachiella dynata]|uniref:Uncharacterized protein n=1 Tax=Symmachiella dynata TaxID=2527995 RepID=A0A517ZW50_9PLAN|nr:hypothetical protein [Symmachiella dynata]QDU46723.1 hypothetical protein Mal52_52450 [Symmachiella dynata]